MNIWQQRYNEQTQLCVQLIDERDRLGALLERADTMLDSFAPGYQGSQLSRSSHDALKDYRSAQRVKEMK